MRTLFLVRLVVLAPLLFVLGGGICAQEKTLTTEEKQLVTLAIEKGVRFLRTAQKTEGSWGGGSAQGEAGGYVYGYTALAAITLLECGVSPKDPGIQRAAAGIRASVSLHTTYELALAILFLDRLGEAKDRSFIQTFALRLIAGQGPVGGWSYKCPVHTNTDQQQLLAMLQYLKAQRDPKAKVVDKAKPPPRLAPHLAQLPVLKDPDQLVFREEADKCDPAVLGADSYDNSNTQFAILGLWVSQRHGVPVERSLRLVLRRFRNSQREDGSWGYHFNRPGEAGTASMTCAALLGLALGHIASQDGDQSEAYEKALEEMILKGLEFLGAGIELPEKDESVPPLKDFYFVWSVERVGVLYGLRTIGDKDWYHWGARMLTAHQTGTGAWPGDQFVHSSFALLFLVRANLVADLTSKLPNFTLLGIKKKPTPVPIPVVPPKPVETPVVAKTPTPPPPSPFSEAPPEATPEPVTAAPPPAEAAPRGSSKLTGIAVILACILLAGAGAGAVYYFNNRAEDQPKKRGGSPRSSGKRFRDDDA